MTETKLMTDEQTQFSISDKELDAIDGLMTLDKNEDTLMPPLKILQRTKRFINIDDVMITPPQNDEGYEDYVFLNYPENDGDK